MDPGMCLTSYEDSPRVSMTRISSPLVRRSLSSCGVMRGTSLASAGPRISDESGVSVGGSDGGAGTAVGAAVSTEEPQAIKNDEITIDPMIRSIDL